MFVLEPVFCLINFSLTIFSVSMDFLAGATSTPERLIFRNIQNSKFYIFVRFPMNQ